MNVVYETLGPGDEERLDEFLSQHAASSMFLRSNARAAGLFDEGALLQGTYVAALREGRIEAVAGHFWNGILVLQAPSGPHLAGVATHAVRRSGRHVAGIAGPWAQVVAAREALEMSERESRASPEALYALELDSLRVPAPLAAGMVRCVVPSGALLDAAVEMRVAYCVETLGQADTESLRDSARNELVRLAGAESTFALVEHDGAPEGCARAVGVGGFNARLPDCVQLGGVFTPPERRGRGHARALVAGALLAARERGAERAVLFTEEDNTPARRAYEALGFRVVGSYGLCLFR